MKIFFRLAPVILLLLNADIFPQISVGAIGVLSLSNISGDAPDNTVYTGRTAAGGGLILNYRINREITISLQPMFQPKGATVSYDLPSYKEQRDSLTAKFSYFDIPVIINVKASKIMYVGGGLDFGMPLDAEAENIHVPGKTNLTNFLKSFEISALFSVGAKIPIDNFSLIIEGRYSLGLINAGNFPENSETGLAPQFRNTSLQLLVGALYIFNSTF